MRLHASIAGGTGSIPRELRSHMPQGAVKKKKKGKESTETPNKKKGHHKQQKKAKTRITGEIHYLAVKQYLLSYKQPELTKHNEFRG